ncbi:MAG TPA: TrpB-like pyridoxal phosphate-dependent enzyme [Thermotogota bacterium]|jgi:tryptophan synthase beta chain|nr:TrpB-like pyridoxal phosphate-dependent enzyme [Thermotogota bacterium]NLH18941.1 TrpB-like pyridoxal phosphate-dependent enzyme [Thermotogaceae bacterium]OQC30607.1 MAG: Tryptophan synthase beta chain [Thermotogota bacterium ADurb.Bin062]HNW47319.1 TrpB-like pyridoxal phosphate-dependent enzyme [Thermotogota bacterium]HNY82108.1 TrpB-like pyridoxal phosphate-dependent enzyme [Thermotogota bacterium]
MKKREQCILSPEEIPYYWYNVKADLPFTLDPILHPGTNQPAKPEDLKPIFPDGLIEQEFTLQREVPIPEAIRDEYAVYRPSPLVHATRLEEYLDTPAKIYFKDESVSPCGSHKVNTALAQAYFNKREGIEKLVTETGAGQWGSALAYAGKKFGLTVEVYMVRVSYLTKPARQQMMHLFGAEVYPSPSERTEHGRAVLETDPNCNGSLGMAITDAVEVTVKSKNAKYSLGSVLDHVLLHQTVIGQEVKKQLKKMNVKPDILVACVGGGSNFGGFVLPFIPDRLKDPHLEIIASEPEACPSLMKGEFRYDFGDTGHLTPLLKMCTLGSDFLPPPIHAGGLRYHGASPIVSRLVAEKYVRPDDLAQDEILQAAQIFSLTEGIIPAPESAHAIATVIKEAKKCKANREPKTIVFNLSGHGHLDLASYDFIAKINGNSK